ncbi:signal peptide peptidase SppA [Marinomonas sp. M1K-6]|uniref:Signal peptide peptidase SppA n=1 Tax=Marinomonas profundi TaxID=2726122 RepID=A0A847QZN4_9GAMM|nr:signal peptide peptidase SppA [Marinomonas profundi]NLQ16412.1 signal peptide peptidase SppA [Marinomonas profundi]UDV03015.1 signal peptide peptidase SppA [Marinomonas profundi]
MSWTEEDDRKQSLNEAESTQDEKEVANKMANKDSSTEDNVDPNKAIWSLLEKTLSENLIEKRRARRWRIFFRFTTLVIFLTVIVGWFAKSNFQDVSLEGDVVAMIPMRGVIGADNDIESSEFVRLLNAAYQNTQLKGVIIEMNSPGGSPVHSGIIYDAIRAKEQSHPDIPVLVVVEDMAASGGYYIASAANEIYADKASLVGSIGVISSSFDASHLLEKIGVERRTFTAGRNKAFLDPFAPMTEEAKTKWQAVLDETHQQFIHAVKEGRGDRLIITDDVFSGMVFTGSQAVEIGLIDGLSSVNTILDTRFPDAEPIFYEPKQDSWKELAKEFGVEMATKVINTTHIQ